MKLSSRRAEILSLAALVLQFAFFGITLWLSWQTGSLAVQIEAWHFLGGMIIWAILLIQFHQRRLAEEEQLDSEQYRRLHQEGKDTSVFEGALVDDQLYLAGRRLVWLEKYLLGIFSVFSAVYLIVMGILLYFNITMTLTEVGGKSQYSFLNASEDSLTSTIVGLAILWFFSFLFSYYAIGMSKQAEWRPLRAGGSYLLSNSLICFVLALIIAWVKYGNSYAEEVAAYVLVGLMVLIGVETILNLVLDAFRPRIKGQYRRAPYESRLLGLVSEPGGILKTAAHAIDYQFGFKVSETWFYKLVERAVAPLLLAMIFFLYMLSCLSIVPPGNLGVLERWGRPLNIENPCESGLHFKLPWPVDTIRKFPVDQVQIIEVGFEGNETTVDDEGRRIRPWKPIMWTTEHWKAEYPFIVAVGDRVERGMLGEAEAGLAPAAEQTALPAGLEEADETEFRYYDLLVVALVVHYRIADVAQYGYGRDYCYQNPHELMQSLCNNQTVLYAASSDIDQLLGPGRQITTELLGGAIQSEVDRYQLGVEILFVGMEAVHPPRTVAPSFEKVFGAHQERQAIVLMAQGEAMSKVAASRGESIKVREQAKAYAYERPEVEKARSERFLEQMKSYEQGGSVYLMREYFSILDTLVPPMRKYVTATEAVGRSIYEINLEEKLTPDLFTNFGLGMDKQESDK